MCKLCDTTSVPTNYGSERKCGFDNNGIFQEDNWNCETLNKFRSLIENTDKIQYGDDETLYQMYLYDNYVGIGWVTLVSYKQRGTTSVGFLLTNEGIKPLTEDVTLKAINNLETLEEQQ